MSYMCGDYYIYPTEDGIRIHTTTQSDLFLPQHIFDALVVMRYAQLEEEELEAGSPLADFEKEVAKKYVSNGSSSALARKYGMETFKDALSEM